MATFYHYYVAMKNISVRVPDELHAALRALAEQERRSLNAEIVYLLEQSAAEQMRGQTERS